MLVFLHNRQPTKNDTTKIVVASKDERVTRVEELPVTSAVNQMRWLEAPQVQMRVFASPLYDDMLSRIWSSSVRLDTLFKYRAGCKPYEEGKGSPPQTKATLENKPYTGPSRKTRSWMPLLRGNDIQRFAVLSRKKEWIHYGEWLAAPRTMEVFSGPRILIQAIRNPSLKERIVSAFTNETFITRINVYSLLKIDSAKANIHAILALLNSRLMNWILCKEYGLHTYVITGVLALPVHKCLLDHNSVHGRKMAALVMTITSLKANNPSADTTKYEREIDDAVYKLYGLTPDEIALVEGFNTSPKKIEKPAKAPRKAQAKPKTVLVDDEGLD